MTALLVQTDHLPAACVNAQTEAEGLVNVPVGASLEAQE